MVFGKNAYNADQVRILATLSLMMILSTTIFLLRLLARRISVARYWYDDYVAFVALVLSYGPTICVLIAVQFGLGEHAESYGKNGVSHNGVSHVIQLGYFTQIFWQLTMPVVKSSLLLFYVRIFPNRRMRIVSCITGAIMWSFCIASIIVDIDTCTPVSYFWNKTIKGHCINTDTFYFVGSTMQLVTDVAVLAIPLPVVYNLNIGTTKKIGLSVIFLLGGIVCGASTMRIVLTSQFIPKDITGLAVNVAIWTCVEVSLAVICACIPCLTPLVLRVMGKKRPSPQDTSDAINPSHKRATLGKGNGFHRMHELSELGATFEMTINGGSYADCRASECIPDCNLPPNGINVTKVVEQSIVSQSL